MDYKDHLYDCTEFNSVAFANYRCNREMGLSHKGMNSWRTHLCLF